MQSFGFENDNVKSSTWEKFAGEKGKTYLVSFAAENQSDFFLGVEQHYSNRLETGWQCLSTPQSQEICCTHEYDGSEAKWRVGTVLVVYKTNEDGAATGIEKIVPWIFSAKVFDQLKRIFKEYGHVDLLLTYTDTKYQTFTVMPKRSCVWLSSEKLKGYTLPKAATAYKQLPKMLANKISLAEIKEHLGLGGVAADSASSLNLDDLASSI